MASFLDDLLGSLGVANDDSLQQHQDVASRIATHETTEQKEGTGTVESKIIDSKKKKKEKAIKTVKQESHKWTNQLRDIATSEQVRYESSSKQDRTNDVRIVAETYAANGDGDDLLSALADSGVVQDRCVSLKSLQPSEKMLKKKAEQEAAIERSRLMILMKREQAKATWHNRQKGKGNRRKVKKRMDKDHEKVMEALERSNPEIIAKMRKDYEDQRAAIRMMPNHGKRKKWAKIAARFGNSDAVADDAARFFEKKRETSEVLNKMDEQDVSDDEAHSGSDDANYSASDSESYSDSDSDISVGGAMEDFGEAEGKRGSKKRSSPSAAASVPEVTKKAKKVKVPNVIDTDLTAFTNEALGEQVDNVAEMFVGSGVEDANESIRAIAERQQDSEQGERPEDDTLIGWGNGWAGENYAEKLEEKRLQKEQEIEDQLKDKKKKPIYINRKLSQKFAKYFTTAVPEGFSNEAEYKVKMNQPLGPEWNTVSGVRSKTKPKVFVEKGTVIQPLGDTVIVVGNKRKTELKSLDR